MSLSPDRFFRTLAGGTTAAEDRYLEQIRFVDKDLLGQLHLTNLTLASAGNPKYARVTGLALVACGIISETSFLEQDRNGWKS